jgi:hypothetical protein
MVCEHHPSPRPRPKSQAAGRARARARARARTRARVRAVWLRSPSAPPPCARASPPAPWAGRPCHTPVASSWRRGSPRSTAAASSRRAARARRRHRPRWEGQKRPSFWKTINRLTRRAAPAPEARGGAKLNIRSICDRPSDGSRDAAPARHAGQTQAHMGHTVHSLRLLQADVTLFIYNTSRQPVLDVLLCI